MGGGGGGQMMTGGDAGGEAAAEEQVKEKTHFDVELSGFDAKAKIKIIKEIRGILDLGLKEAKEMVESAPCWLKKELKKEEAEEMKEKLEGLGAEVKLV